MYMFMNMLVQHLSSRTHHGAHRRRDFQARESEAKTAITRNKSNDGAETWPWGESKAWKRGSAHQKLIRV